MAKKIELEFWTQLDASPQSGQTAASGIAAAISDFIYADLDAKVDTALADLAKGEPTQTLRDVFFDSIVGAGIVSRIAGGSKQVALAHRFYFFARQRDPETGRRFTHGELVAVGLVMQHAYNGRPDEAAALAARLRGWGLAASVAELGLPVGPGELDACADFIGATKTMKAAVAIDPAAPARLRDALRAVF